MSNELKNERERQLVGMVQRLADSDTPGALAVGDIEAARLAIIGLGVLGIASARDTIAEAATRAPEYVAPYALDALDRLNDPRPLES